MYVGLFRDIRRNARSLPRRSRAIDMPGQEQPLEGLPDITPAPLEAAIRGKCEIEVPVSVSRWETNLPSLRLLTCRFISRNPVLMTVR